MVDTHMEPYVMIRFNRKSGKITLTMEALSSAMLRLAALQRTTKTTDSLIFGKETGQVVFYVHGSPDGRFPEVEKENLGHIKDYCPGLLEAVQAG